MICTIKDRDGTVAKYVDGSLSSEERDAFDAHCFECDRCYSALSLHERVAGLVRDEGDVLFPEVHSPRAKPGPFSVFLDRVTALWIIPRFRLGVVLACACICLLLIGRNSADHPASISDLADRSACSYIEMSMRDSDPADRAFRTAMKAYEDENYESAVHQLETVLEKDERYGPARFYLAVSLFLTDRIADAEIHFRQVIKDEPDRERGLWYMAQIYLLHADQVNAEIMLRQVAALGQPEFSGKAKKLLKKIAAVKND